MKIKKNRREFVSDILKVGSAVSLSSTIIPTRVMGSEEIKLNGRKPFVLCIHLGSFCGMASGLVQPLSAGVWAENMFARGASESVNPLLNQHVQDGNMVFHQYNKFLQEISSDMCLVNGNPVALSHPTARAIRQTGNSVRGYTPYWAMGLAQNCKTTQNPNPIVILDGVKTHSVFDVNPIDSNSLDDFQDKSRDSQRIPTEYASMWNTMSERFKKRAIGSVLMGQQRGENFENLIGILSKGFAQLATIGPDSDSLRSALSDSNFAALISENPDNGEISPDSDFLEQLVLAGIMAKTGIANGMNINIGGGDTHNGGSDVAISRQASSIWAQITLFWKWIKEQGLDNDVTIMISHDFARGRYGSQYVESEIINSTGSRETIRQPGTGHGFYMGMMFINRNVPSKGRIGNVIANQTAVEGIDSTGSFKTDGNAYESASIVGSMFRRIYPDLFPTERLVRKHWPDFVEILPILEA